MKKYFLFCCCSWLLLATPACSTHKGTTHSPAQAPGLAGTWILDLVPAPGTSFDSLYPETKPELTFDLQQQRFSGFTGCNRVNGPLVSATRNISFKGDMTMTMMACPGEGENVFLTNLKRINAYSISANGKELTLIQGDIALMHFHKK